MLADVCRAMDIANPRAVAARLDDDEKDAVDIADAMRNSCDKFVPATREDCAFASLRHTPSFNAGVVAAVPPARKPDPRNRAPAGLWAFPAASRARPATDTSRSRPRDSQNHAVACR